MRPRSYDRARQTWLPVQGARERGRRPGDGAQSSGLLGRRRSGLDGRKRVGVRATCLLLIWVLRLGALLDKRLERRGANADTAGAEPQPLKLAAIDPISDRLRVDLEPLGDLIDGQKLIWFGWHKLILTKPTSMTRTRAGSRHVRRVNREVVEPGENRVGAVGDYQHRPGHLSTLMSWSTCASTHERRSPNRLTLSSRQHIATRPGGPGSAARNRSRGRSLTIGFAARRSPAPPRPDDRNPLKA